MEINGKQYEPKVNFKFEKVADKKYSEVVEGQKTSGIEGIYEDLLNDKPSALVKFWDCATAHYKKEQPIVDDIEDALSDIIEDEGIDRLQKEAFEALDESGFFKKQLQNFWKNLDMASKLAKTEQEAEQIKAAQKLYKEKYKNLKA
ncbi:tail assembly chaperone [Virgibacillus siamensis]|uniref:tail assembly chaperone n=1 Tax=Virgibacillus siamensis TaxID=480071 RepID=UPI000984F741|nr:tail assembly chaperone [Virgibacillus siamensis]